MKHRRKSVHIHLLDDSTYTIHVDEIDRTDDKHYLTYSGSGGLTSIIKRARDELAVAPVKEKLGGVENPF